MNKKISFIGSGFGSLCLASLLVRKGYSVDIFEQSSSIGGYAQTLNIDNYTFTLGPRYLWDFGPGDIGTRFFETLDLFNKNDFLKLDEEGFDEVYLGKELVMCVPMGWERYRNRMIEQFPAEQTGIDKFFTMCADIYETFSPYIHHNLDYSGYRSLLEYILKTERSFHQAKTLGKYGFKTLAKAFDSCGLSNTVRSILSAHLAITVEAPQHISFVAYIIATLNYHRGSYYPKTHMHGLIDSMVQYIKGCGGTFHMESKVTALKLTRGEISSLIIDNKEQYNADLFISNIDPAATLSLLDKGKKKEQSPWYERGNSLLSFFIGYEISHETNFPFGKAQKWYLRDNKTLQYDIFNKGNLSRPGEPEYLYLNSPSTISGYGVLGPTAQSKVVTGFAPSSYQYVERMSDQEHEDYRRAREEAILDVIERNIWPEVRNGIKTFHLLTPRDYKENLLAPEGHIYAKRFRSKDIFINRVLFDSKVNNLKFCSAFPSFPGIASCIRGAGYLYEKIVGEKPF